LNVFLHPLQDLSFLKSERTTGDFEIVIFSDETVDECRRGRLNIGIRFLIINQSNSRPLSPFFFFFFFFFLFVVGSSL